MTNGDFLGICSRNSQLQLRIANEEIKSCDANAFYAPTLWLEKCSRYKE